MLIYKIIDVTDWQAFQATGRYDGSADDRRDGFVHLSTAAQISVTLAKHFPGRDDLVLAAVDTTRLGDALRWEPSRGEAMFPHLYAPLPLAAVGWWQSLALGADGIHVLPDEVV